MKTKKIINLFSVVIVTTIMLVNINILTNTHGKSQITLRALEAKAVCENMEWNGSGSVILLMEECYYSGPRGQFAGCEDGGSECSAYDY